jgi:hypothetical protein
VAIERRFMQWSQSSEKIKRINLLHENDENKWKAEGEGGF